MGPTDKVLDPPSEDLGLNLNSETSQCCHLEHVLFSPSLNLFLCKQKCVFPPPPYPHRTIAVLRR